MGPTVPHRGRVVAPCLEPRGAVLRVPAGGAARDLHDQPIESVHARLRKIIKTRGHFPSDEAATKLIWLALRNITAQWSRATREWKAAMNQFAIIYEDGFTLARQ
jgi:putative transposase